MRHGQESRVGVAIIETGDSNLIRLDGAIEIGSATELKTALVRALHTGKDLGISVEAEADFDVTVFQVLWAAKREALVRGVAFKLTDPLPEPARSSLRDLGLDELLNPESLLPCAREEEHVAS